ncbi:hypothetical protein [Streptomyces sp. NPDC060027]|uniref:hypothetical protein n=1 Tax=Streptomyces sp. NPDC060027 TaxID=3347040 RepID=UPI0036C40540
MPIRPEMRARYPRDWPQISRRIRFDRAGGRCECDGRCGRRHVSRCTAVHGEPHPATGSRVVLTVAHLDDVPENCADDNLAAMCQACHLAYDAALHARTAARTRAARLVAPGQTAIPLAEGDPA